MRKSNICETCRIKRSIELPQNFAPKTGVCSICNVEKACHVYLVPNDSHGDIQTQSRKLTNGSQNKTIYELFETERRPLTAFDVFTILNKRGGRLWIITSVRRACTDLTKKGFIHKMDATKAGGYGEKNHFYKHPNAHSDTGRQEILFQ